MSTPPERDIAGDRCELADVVAARLRGYAEVEERRRAELRAMSQDDAARIADELQRLMPLMPAEPERGSGLVEQQRLFSRARS